MASKEENGLVRKEVVVVAVWQEGQSGGLVDFDGVGGG